MKRFSYISLFLSLVVTTSAQDIKLPAPETNGGMPIMDVLKNRRSSREFNQDGDPTPQQLSNLLWAARGFNRSDKLTVPSALNKQETSLYVITRNGIYRYDPASNNLKEIASGDFRAECGQQPFVATAPLNIAIVSDKALMDNDIYAGVDAGAIMQNIYLWCSANNADTVARGSFDGEKLSKLFGLKDNERVILVQTVGMSKE